MVTAPTSYAPSVRSDEHDGKRGAKEDVILKTLWIAPDA